MASAAAGATEGEGRVRSRRGLRRPRGLDLVLALTESDLRLRYGRGGWRLVKWLLEPVAVVGVYLILVSVLLKVDRRAAGLSLACAVVPFSLVATTVTNAMDAVKHRLSIILNMNFGHVAIPLTTTLTEWTAFGSSAGLLAAMMAAYGVTPTAAILWLPLAVAVNFLVAVAFAYPAALFGVWFPDLRTFAVSFVRTTFFLAPGLVPLSVIGGRAHEWLKLNPLTGIFESYRSALLYGHAPAAWELLYPGGMAVLVLALFLPLYRNEARQFAKVVTT